MRRIIPLPLLAFLIFLVSAPFSHVAAQCTNSNGTIAYYGNANSFGQTFSPSCSGNITQASFSAQNSAATTVSVNIRACSCNGPILGTATTSGNVSSGTNTITFSSGVPVVAGGSYFIEFYAASGIIQFYHSGDVVAGNLYTGGGSGSTCSSAGGYDLTYSVTVATSPVTVTTGSVSTSLCAGASSVSVPYTATGTYTGSNVFTAQLSDASGSFCSPVNIGTATSTGSGTISATIPGNTSGGTGYRIRVVSSNPATIGTDNGTNIGINPTPTVSTPADQTVCSGTATSATFSGVATTYRWTNSNTAIGLAASGTGNISFNASNNTNAALTASLTVTPEYDNPIVVNGAQTSIMTDRLFQFGTASSCAAPVSFPGSTYSGSIPYWTYSFTNNTGSSKCVTVTYQAIASGFVFLTAYDGSFNPSNLSANYLATGGGSSFGPNGAQKSFSFTVAASQTIVLVSNATGTGSACSNFSVTISGLNVCTGIPKTFNLTVNPSPAATVTPTAPSCPGGSNGSIVFGTPTVGSSPFSYSINGGSGYQSGNVFNNLSAGSGYSAIVKDNNNCTSTAQAVTVAAGVDNTPPTVTATYNSSTIANNGTIAVNNDAGNCSKVVNYAVTPSDNCGILPPTNVSFSATGAVQHYTVPAGVTKLTVKAWGGGGGGGGNDGNIGGAGGGGAYATSVINVSPNDVLDIYVGKGGMGGDGCNPGSGSGSGGFGYGTGGNGGNPGTSGCSGGGGGGGGGTAIVKGSTVYIVAAGGGGGGGAGNSCCGYGTGAAGGGGNLNGAAAPAASAGSAGANSNNAGTNGSDRGTGNDGGGGGGGGGGYLGGTGAGAPSCDCGAAGGGGGSSLASTTIAGSGQTPGNDSDPLLCTNCGKGGYGQTSSHSSTTSNGSTAGGDGLLVISYNGFQQTAGLASGAAFPVGTTTNTFVATDNSGNQTTFSFDVVVTDAEMPLITGLSSPINMTGYCTAVPKANVPLGTPLASDNCGFTGGTPVITNDAPASFPVGTTVVHYNVTDKNNNTSVFNQTVNVTAPSTPLTATATISNSLNSTAYPLSGQEISTIYLGWTSANGAASPSAQTEDLTVSPSGGTPPYSYNWQQSSCNGTTLGTPGAHLSLTSSQSPYYSKATWSPDITDVCTGNGNNDNLYYFSCVVTDAHGCATSPAISKRLNVVNPWTSTPGTTGTVQVCHKVAVRGGSVNQLMSVTPSQVATHLAHGDQLGNCALFTGVRSNAPEELEEQRVAVYPNPTTGVFVLELSEVRNGATILITDVAGKTIQTKTIAKDGVPTATFDLSTFSRGMYLISVRDGDFSYRTKIVVE